jgi:hypothetical protein
MPAHTLQPERKVSSRHLAGKNSIISQDLAPSDFHVFLHLKTSIGAQGFHGDEVKEVVIMWFASQAASFYDAGIPKMVLRYKCLSNSGKYVEK